MAGVVKIVVDQLQKGTSVKDATRDLKDLGEAGKQSKFSFTELNNALSLAGQVIRPVAAAVWDVTQTASDLNETVNKTREIFGDSASSIIQWGEDAATSVGLSQRAALDAASGFAIFGSAAGLAGQELNDFATQDLKLAADLASFFNTSVTDAATAIQAAFRGETEPIRRYGVMLDDASIRAKALELGIVSTTKNALTPQQKVLAVNALLWEQTTQAQGDFERTSDGLANSTRILQAEFEDLKAALGEEFLPTMGDAINDLTEFTGWVNDNLDTIKEWGDRLSWVVNPLGRLGMELGSGAREMLGLGKETEDTGKAMDGARFDAEGFSGSLGDLSNSAMDAAGAEKEAAQAAKELTGFYKGLIGDMRSLKDEREGAAEQSQRLKDEQKELEDQLVREQLAMGELTSAKAKLTDEEKKQLDAIAARVKAGQQLTESDYEQLASLKQRGELAKMTDEQIRSGIADQLIAIDEVNKKLQENAEAQKQLTEDTQDATKQRIADTVLERLSKDELTSAEYEFFQDYLVQQGLITAADRDRAIGISQAADSIVADFERQNSVMDTTQAKIDALVNGSPYNVVVNIETTGSIPTIGSGRPTGAANAFGGLHESLGNGPLLGGRDSGGRGYPGEAYYIGTGAQPEVFVPDAAGTFYPRGEGMPNRGGNSVTVNINGGIIDRKTINTLTQEINKVMTQ